jgi:beta-glucosidase
VSADPGLLSRYDGESGQWRLIQGNYRVGLGRSADNLELTANVSLTDNLFGK